MPHQAITTGRHHVRRPNDLLRWLVVWPLVILLVGAGLHVVSAPNAAAAEAAAPGVTDTCDPDVGSTITNGTVTLGVNCFGDLGTMRGNGTGLRYEPTRAEAVTQGCSCEGWGVADLESGTAGFANESEGTSTNLSLASFTATDSTAVSVVDIDTDGDEGDQKLQVVQDFHPIEDTTSDLYEVDVTIRNDTAAAAHLRYRRVMDWDIRPTPFNEFVTLDKGTSPRVAFTSDDGFASADPRAGESSIEAQGSFVDSGPQDHGALFDFDFGMLAAGKSRSFKIYYGAADTEAHAASALNLVNAEAYSFGQPDVAGEDGDPQQGPVTGRPNTFIFAFKDIDGSSLFAPTARVDRVKAYPGITKDLNVLANDTDPNGDPIAILTDRTTATEHGTLSCTTTGCSYTADEDYLGPDSFRYTISDGNGGVSTTTVLIDVVEIPKNVPPVALADELTVDEDTAGTLDVLANDSDQDPDDQLAVTASTDGAKGTVSCATSTCTYTPRHDANGADSFTYTVSDGKDSVTGTVAVTVRPVNDAPVAIADPQVVTAEDTPVTVDLAGNDTDVDGDPLTATARLLPEHGTLTCSGPSCTYTPAPNWSGTDSFTYRAHDATSYSLPMTVAVRVDAVNDAPVAVGDTITTDQDEQGSAVVVGNDTDVEQDPLSVLAWGQPDHGSVTCTTTTCTYVPTSLWHGTDSFTYTVGDGHGGTATGTVAVTVRKVNKAPVAVADQATTDEDVAVAVPVTANDTDLDNPNGDLSAILTTAPSNGTVTCVGGSCTYTPRANWHGTDSFTYRVSDGALDSAPVRVDLTVTSVNDAPVALDDTGSDVAGQPATVQVLANDTDVDGDELSVAVGTAPAHGTVTCGPTTCTYTGQSGYAGPDAFTYTVSDGHAGTATATVRMTVSLPNRAPVATADTVSATEDVVARFDVLANDTDPDGDPRTLVTAATTQPGAGSVSCAGSGACTYTPPADWNGVTTFTYTVSDGHDHTAVGTVTVTVAPANDLPVPGADRLLVDRDRPGSVSVLVNDDDIDGDVLTVSGSVKPLNGQVACTAEGVCTFTPKAHWAGTTAFTYTVSDGHGGTAVGTVDVTVRAVVVAPDAPTIGTPSNKLVKKGTKRYNATATWKAPVWNGGGAITSYKVSVQKMSGTKVASTRKYTAAKTAKSLLLTLARGKYTFVVVAVNKAGASVGSKQSRAITVR